MLPQPVLLTTTGGFGVSSNGFGFVISWAKNGSVVMEAAANLAVANWTAVSTNKLTNGSTYFRDPRWTNYPARFYRVRSGR